MDIIYFELNNWAPGRNYPDAEPFISWMKNDLKQSFLNEKWVKENGLVVVHSLVDMSSNYCITAPKKWIIKNCPDLLDKYKKFIRLPEKNENTLYGVFDCPFLDYKIENIGIHYANITNFNGDWRYIFDN